MNKPCARCKKTVYPVEKLNCLDKIWHKACFSCEICCLKLTMKSYKGYNKLPYCVTHYPTTKFTAVADTPENKRLAKQQMNQSDLIYRKDRKSALEGFTQVADSVSSRQAAHSAQLASNLRYQTAPHQVGREGKDVGEIVNRKDESAAGEAAPTTRQIVPEQPPQQVAAPPAPQVQLQQQMEQLEIQEQAPPPPVVEPEPQQPQSDEVKYIALYDYTAADDDEVTFVEGDVIIDGIPIDEGWMEGTVERTGMQGMLPSNYVQKM